MEEDLRSSGAGLRGFKSHPRHQYEISDKEVNSNFWDESFHECGYCLIFSGVERYL
jgi:hypothetical protein